MAALTLTFDTTIREVMEAGADTRRRVILPSSPCWLKIYCADAIVSLELVNATDATARGTNYSSIPAGATAVERIDRGEVAISTSTGGRTVELTARRFG